MSKIRKRFYANRDLREFDGRLSQVEETLQEILDFLEPDSPMVMTHHGAGLYKVIQGNLILFPPEGTAKKADCEAFMKARLEGDDVEELPLPPEASPIEPETVTVPKPSGRMPKKMGSRETDEGIERYVEFTDDTEMTLTEEQFQKAKEDPATLMELVSGLRT